jgi:hypothetical protein
MLMSPDITSKPTHVVSVADDFSTTPGPRTREEGQYSGELFLDTILKQRFEEAVAANGILLVDLDGTEGYATSFLEAAFGGLVRLHKDPEFVLKRLQFRCFDEPYLKDEIEGYIREALNE